MQQIQTFNIGTKIDDEHLKILLKSVLMITRTTDAGLFSPTLTNFVLQILKLERQLSEESKDLLMRLAYVIGQNESSVNNV